jgi:hypothetical protein
VAAAVGDAGHADNPGHNGSTTAAAADDDDDAGVSLPQEEQQQQQPEPTKQPEAAAAAAAAAAAEAVEEKDWSSVDPAAVDALRTLVAALGDARSLGPVRLQPRGLVNTGNSCFMNCTLQVGIDTCV